MGKTPKNKISSGLMTEGPIHGLIVRFAIPLFLGHLFQQMYNTVDSLIVGNFLGSTSLAAVTGCGNIIFMVVGFFGGLSAGASVVISRNIGARDSLNTEKAVHTAFALGLISSALLTVVCTILAPQILALINTPADVMPEAVSYFRFYFAGSTGLVMYNTLVSIYQASGDSRHPLYFLIISSITNVALDFLFIAVFRWGTGGAAIATSLSQIMSACLAMAGLMRVKAANRLRLRRIRIYGPTLVQVLRNGMPAGFQNSVISFSNVLIQSYINWFGAKAMAGIGAYNRIEGFAFIPVMCFGMALTTFISQNLGAARPERARQGIRFAVGSGVLISEGIGLFIAVSAPLLIAAFVRDPETISFGVLRSRTIAPFFGLCAFTNMMAAVSRGAGRPLSAMTVSLISWCAVRVIVLMTAAAMDFHEIWLVNWIYPLTWFISTIAYIFIYRHLDLAKAAGKRPA